MARPRLATRTDREGPAAGTPTRTVVLAVAALIALGVTALVTLRPRARVAPVPRPVAVTITATALGKVGEEVAFEAEVLQADPARSSLVVLKDRAIGAWIFVHGSCPWPLLTTGRPVRIEGRIVAARDARSIYVDATSVRP